MTTRRSRLPAMSENEERSAARKRLQAQYRALYDEVVDIMFEIDPIGVHVHHSADKFVPEATSILARLRDARFAEDVENIVQQELRRWYGRADSAARILRASARAPIPSALPGTGF